MINVSEALCVDTAEKITVTRTSTGVYTDGIYVKGPTSTFKTLASVQQATPKEVMVLPEGEREKDIRKFISKKPLRGTQDKDGTIADIVTYKGNEYKIIKGADWDSYGYTRSFGARD